MASLAPRSSRAPSPEPPTPIASAGVSGIALSREAPPSERAAGRLVLQGKYRLDAPLAVGGMGSVWSATHVTLERRVAVKFVDLAANDPHVLDRFLREARLAAAIHHPNVVDVVDFGVAENGEPVLVMELLQGETLAERMERATPLATHEIVHVMAQVLSALEAVHQAGILHSDMKPENVMLDVSSSAGVFARLIDFGIAFSIDAASQLRRGRFGTHQHVVNGTPEYMPPEQAEGRTDLDVRADVYAASVMLYELLSGVSPFFDPHPGVVIHKVIEGSHTALVALRPDIPEIAAVVAAGMSHDRASRPPTARELRRMLLAAAGVHEVSALRRTERDLAIAHRIIADRSAEPARSKPRTRGVVTGLVTLTVLALGAALVAAGWPTTPPEVPVESPRELPIGEPAPVERPLEAPPIDPPMEAPPPTIEPESPPPMIDPPSEPTAPRPPRPSPSPDPAPEPMTPEPMAPPPDGPLEPVAPMPSTFLDDPGF